MTTKDNLLLRIRVTRDEYERIRSHAREKELSMAGFVHRAVLKENQRLAAEVEQLTGQWRTAVKQSVLIPKPPASVPCLPLPSIAPTP